jgi:Cys-tRNA(Pro)/Cys-tRNA(Cys) deacylase
MTEATPSVDREDGDPAQRLASFVRAAGIEAEIVFPDGPSATVAEAAATLGVPASQIVKSLLFETRQGDHLLVVASGELRIDRRRLADNAGLPHLKLASAATVLQQTGFPVGGMPPVGHQHQFPVIVDAAVLAEPIVFGGGGRTDAILRILPADIVRLNRATVSNVTEAGS